MKAENWFQLRIVGVTIIARLLLSLSAAGQGDFIFAYGGVAVANTDHVNVRGRSSALHCVPPGMGLAYHSGRATLGGAHSTASAGVFCPTKPGNLRGATDDGDHTERARSSDRGASFSGRSAVSSA